METKKYDAIIVGSGAGGGTLARELSRRGKRVAVLEKGKRETRYGTFRDSLRYFDVNRFTRTPLKSGEGVILWRAFMAGGSTFVSCGNGVRCLETELCEAGLDLTEELKQAEEDMGIKPISHELLSEGSLALNEAAEKLGYAFDPMPKFIDAGKCVGCGQCVFGCVHGAKWTVLEYLDEAQTRGAELLYEHDVRSIETSGGRAVGVRAGGPHGPIKLDSGVVVLAAGGLGTPVILQKTGIKEAGEGLFIDMFVNTYGVTDGLNQVNEPAMTLVNHEHREEHGFILSPFVNHPRALRFVEMGAGALAHSSKTLIGIMTKTMDDPVGKVLPDGSITKTVTEADRTRLEHGTAIASDILERAGVRRSAISVTKPQGAHPGGTAAIGKIVDSDLQTGIDGLFVCDASVLPRAPGLPPILTIVALAKRLAGILA